MKIRPLSVLISLLCLASSALAIEVSLEENKAERGSVGYIDLQKVFRLYPETHKAKQSYAEIVRQAEEQVNLKKAELFTLRGELSKLKAEREFFSKTPIPAAPIIETPPAPAEPAPVEPAPIEPPVEASTPSAPVPLEPQPRSDLPPELRDLPGMSKPLGTVSPAAVPAAPTPPPAPAPDEEAAKEASVVPAGQTESWLAYEDALHRRGIRQKELDSAVSTLENKVADSESLLAEHQRQVENNLIEIEDRRSELLLGRIYEAVRETARLAGVSVVMDKSQILYGQNSVDLTDRVLKRLEAPQP